MQWSEMFAWVAVLSLRAYGSCGSDFVMTVSMQTRLPGCCYQGQHALTPDIIRSV